MLITIEFPSADTTVGDKPREQDQLLEYPDNAHDLARLSSFIRRIDANSERALDREFDKGFAPVIIGDDLRVSKGAPVFAFSRSNGSDHSYLSHHSLVPMND